MKSKSIKGVTIPEITDRFDAALGDGFKPTLAIVFLSMKQDRKAVCQLLNKHNVAIFGATTAGEFIDGEIGEESIAILLMDLQPDYFKMEFMETGTETTRDIARKIGETGVSSFAKPAFIVASGGISTDGEMIVRGIEDVVGPDIPIFGGMAGDDFNMTGTYVFTNNYDSDDAIVALILDNQKINVQGLATSGWRPFGTIRTVTHSEGNVVYTIDDEPALDLIIRYMGVSKDIDTYKEVIVNIGSEFPMQIQREDSVPILRAPLYANQSDRSLVCAGSVPQGAQIRFSLPPDFNIIEKVVAECNEVKAFQPLADALIMFSCKARHLSLGPMVSEEIDQIKDVWGSPMVGFFSYGEFGKTINGKHEFHNNTCSLVVLKEN
ncbi:MAG: FIST C-terminal domain-containing protein [Bacteroidetes bacterium]|nr:FIST C-terminal domain-containing protein [Bacteroidota bacterium]